MKTDNTGPLNVSTKRVNLNAHAHHVLGREHMVTLERDAINITNFVIV